MSEKMSWNDFIKEIEAFQTKVESIFEPHGGKVKGDIILSNIEVIISIERGWTDEHKKLAKKSGLQVKGDCIIFKAKGQPEDILAELKKKGNIWLTAVKESKKQ